MNIPNCPRGCYDKEEYVYAWPSRDTETSRAYLCTACGTIFWVFWINAPNEKITKKEK